MTRNRLLAVLAITLVAVAVGLFQPTPIDAKPIAEQPQNMEVVGHTPNGEQARCVRLGFVANDGGVGYREYLPSQDGGYSFVFDAGMVNDASAVLPITINNDPTLKTGARYRVISVGEAVFIERNTPATTTGGSIYVAADSPEEMSFSTKTEAAGTIYGRCATATTCAVDLCPLYTPPLTR